VIRANVIPTSRLATDIAVFWTSAETPLDRAHRVRVFDAPEFDSAARPSIDRLMIGFDPLGLLRRTFSSSSCASCDLSSDHEMSSGVGTWHRSSRCRRATEDSTGITAPSNFDHITRVEEGRRSRPACTGKRLLRRRVARVGPDASVLFHLMTGSDYEARGSIAVADAPRRAYGAGVLDLPRRG
jgi:hypothetical protein